MKPVPIFLASLFLLACALIAGCTSGTTTAPETTVPVTTATPVPTTLVATPQPTSASPADAEIQSLPEAQMVSFELTKDRPTSKIHLLYQGGPGTVFTQKVALWVYKEDGTYQEYLMKDGKRPSAGDEVVAKGTRGGDRCVVFVTSGGVVYKVIDKKLYSDI
ncbi:hypothetical protein [Methanoregula formicica]|uniref:Uncharacterized protein n=1 Tax=Methanoregula formicica (strain DSM 22288 / NBRC 105244 / SMSP) TaxID=593750 RepID=L0HD19_METFS|nr:hypothetical protein [Methanoregula formicica]AGB02627.1 hypothetical protein Metfor_1597 [Methanoregula formicica SMSP]